MEFLYLIQGFFGAPGLVIGLFALIGSILMHKKPTDIILSTLTTILGFFLLACGGAAMGAALVHFSNVFKALVGSDAAIGNCDALALLIIKDAPKMAAVVALMLLVSMILNLVLARTSKYKDIHLSSHHILYLCVGLVIMLEFAGLNMNLNSTDALFAVIFGGILMSLYMTLTPQLTKPAMRQLTGEDKMYIAHYNTFAASLGVLFGYLFERYGERKSRSAEDINMPK
jgi:PTS system ascorbate-specific IIC component